MQGAGFLSRLLLSIGFLPAGCGFREALIQNSVGSVSLLLLAMVLAKMHDERN
jgi:hypothetical protein